MTSVDLRGVNVAMATAFDRGRFCDHVDLLIDAGVHGIVLNSGTGEFAYMNDDELLATSKAGIDHIAGRVPAIVQTSRVGLDHCIEASKAAVDQGADAIMVLPPWLEGPFSRGVMHHYTALADAVDTTIVIYNIPAVSGVEITPDMWAELSSHPNVGYMKDSSGDLAKMQDLIAAGPGVMGGCDPVAPFALLAGAVGWIWGAANVMPHECVALYDGLVGGHADEALDLWRERMQPFNGFIWNNPYEAEYITCVKAATGMRSGDLGPPRLPQLPLTDDAMAALRATVDRLEEV